MATRTNRQTEAGGILYVVATPIGNPDDISARAIRTLAEVSLIACEDTRRTGQMLARHQIGTPTISHYEHNEERRVPELVARLKAGREDSAGHRCGHAGDFGSRLSAGASGAGCGRASDSGAGSVSRRSRLCRLPESRPTGSPSKDLCRRATRREVNCLRNCAASGARWSFTRLSRRLADTLGAMAVAFGESRDAAVVCRNHQDLRADDSRDAWRTGTALSRDPGAW